MEFKAIEAIPGWYSIAKKAGELYGTLDAYEKVPMYYRAINLRADALGTVPYELTRAGNAVDYPFTTPLENLIQQTERALMLTGRAFWLRLYRGRVLYGFQFLNPRSIEVTYHPEKQQGADYMTGLTFTQKIDGQVHAVWTIADVVYFHEPSIKTDINEEVSPAKVALQSAQLAYYLERFASAFFEHGAQPALVLSLDKSITPPELERMKSHWTRYVENVSNAFKTFFFRGDVKAQIVTFPLDQMDMVPIQERAVMNIVSTFGVPRTMIEASAANYATADSDRQSFWRETIVPRLAFYERVLNEQLFKPLKYQFQFLPEKLDVFQVDEAARANSLVLLVQAGLPLAAAMKQLGYENIEEALGLPLPQIIDNDGGVNVDTNTPVNSQQNAAPDEVVAIDNAAGKRVAELEKYEAKALARFKPGKSAAVKFTSDVLPGYLLDYIDSELESVKKKSEIIAVFASVKLGYADMTPGEQKVYKAIVKKLEKRNEDISQKIVAGDYSGIDTDLRGILDKFVADTVLAAGAERVTPIRGMADEQSAALIEQGIKQHGKTYLDQYWNPFLQDLSATEKSYIDKVIADYMVTPGNGQTDVMQQLSMFGQLRASRIAFTEPTRAASQQTLQIFNNARAAGINVVRIWNTEKDRKVCQMCQELDGLTDDQWQSVYKGDQDIMQGAPAHVNCRCDTGIDYVAEVTQPAETPAEVLTVDEATAPIPTPTQVPLLQRDAAEIAQHIRDAVPADLLQDVAEIKAWGQGGSTQLYDQVMQHAFGTPEYDAAFAKYLAEGKRIYGLQNTIALKEERVYKTLLQDLRHPTPATAVLTFTGKTTAAQRARITELVQATVGIAPDNGTPIAITVRATSSIGGSMGGGVMTINREATASTIVHESLHGLQQHQQYGNAATDAFAAIRTAGEKPVKLSSTGFSNGGNTYVDNTDSGYTFRIYKNRPADYAKFPEVLTTAFDHISNKPAAKDKELLELFAQIVKDGGK
jgi:HK97 family phage portal protein